ncbi:MAG TPA: hypothetical protein DCR55_17060 [Lentisphaeria bacterium]|nr:hypothetical protein [Lentisphaeria bacterium]
MAIILFPSVFAKSYPSECAMFFLATVTPFYAFEQSDTVGRFIVLILAVLSTLSWTLFVDRFLYLKGLKMQVTSFLEFYEMVSGPGDVFSQLKNHHGPLVAVTNAGLTAIAELHQLPPTDLAAQIRRTGIPEGMSTADIDRIDSAMEKQLDLEILEMERHLSTIGTVVSVSPFLGLLGTVWGVMMAFCGMAAKGQPDINSLAPGVSGALLTTVVALLVAIPSVWSYNYLSNKIRHISVEMEGYSAEFLSRVRVASQLDN